MAEPDELEIARQRFPVGAHVTGKVVKIPFPGAIGIVVELDGPPAGFVDVIHLPIETNQWPSAGTVASFEVLQHTPGQIRLFPLGEGIPLPPPSHHPETEQDWLACKARYPVGSEVAGTVTRVFSSNREFAVSFDDRTAILEWKSSDLAPTVADTGRYRVTAHLDYTRRIILAPAT